MMTTEQTFTLSSTDLIHTPGVLRFLVQMAKSGDRTQAMVTLRAGWPSLSDLAYDNILDGAYLVDAERETVIVKG